VVTGDGYFRTKRIGGGFENVNFFLHQEFSIRCLA